MLVSDLDPLLSLIVTVYCVEQENLCGFVGKEFGALHSGKAEIQRIIAEFNQSSSGDLRGK